MVISAVDLDKLEDDDIEEIGKKFDREETPEGSEEPEIPEGGEVPEVPEGGEQSPEPAPDSELGEAMDKLESFINTPISTEESEFNEVNLDKYNDLGENDSDIMEVELDLDEIKADINKSIGETLSKYFK